MTIRDYERLKNLDLIKEKVICGDDLFPYLKDRTLLFGYTLERETFHVYLKDKTIHTIIYKLRYRNDDMVGVPMDMREIFVGSNRDYVPDKRLYPAKCDYMFCTLLKLHDVSLPFTVWTEPTEKSDFYGFTIEDNCEVTL